MSEWRAVAIEQARTYADLPIISSSFEMATVARGLYHAGQYCIIFVSDIEIQITSNPITSEVFVTEAAKLVLNRVLGEGGFGMVYEAHHTDWGTVAYKKMNIGYVKTHER